MTPARAVACAATHRPTPMLLLLPRPLTYDGNCSSVAIVLDFQIDPSVQPKGFSSRTLIVEPEARKVVCWGVFAGLSVGCFTYYEGARWSDQVQVSKIVPVRGQVPNRGLDTTNGNEKSTSGSASSIPNRGCCLGYSNADQQ